MSLPRHALQNLASQRRVDAAWLAGFRIVFGTVLAISMLRFIAYGWIDRLWGQTRFQFKYWGFSWVEPLPASELQLLFVALLVLAIAVAAGACFRLTAPLFALGLTYIQLIDVSTYLNHYYLAALLCWLLSVSPAHKLWSVDAWLMKRFRRSKRSSEARDDSVSVRWLYLFRFQVGVVYFFAGLGKAQPDWLLHAQPLRTWLGASVDLPVVGPWLALEWAPMLFSWCGFLFDTTIVGWLLWRRTRLAAYGVVIVFHVLTRMLFPIGMFPVIMVLSALCFFEPNWPRALGWRLRRVFGGAAEQARRQASAASFRAGASVPSRTSTWLWRVAALYCLVQLALPLRAHAYGGDVLWHEQGMRFSWRVMVRAKGGSTTFLVHQPNAGKTWHVSPSRYLTPLQESEMSSQPDLILQLAKHIARDFEQRGYGKVEVRAESRVSLNGRRSQPLVDPSVDLTLVSDSLSPAAWILPAPQEAPHHTKVVL